VAAIFHPGKGEENAWANFLIRLEQLKCGEQFGKMGQQKKREQGLESP
jgi:hypothetical protein